MYMEIDSTVSESNITEQDVGVGIIAVMLLLFMSGVISSSVVFLSLVGVVISLMSTLVLYGLVDNNMPFNWKLWGSRTRVRRTKTTIEHDNSCLSCGTSDCEGVRRQGRREFVVCGISVPIEEERSTYDCVSCLNTTTEILSTETSAEQIVSSSPDETTETNNQTETDIETNTEKEYNESELVYDT